MTVNKPNPDSTILSQMDKQWAKFAALIVWKYHNNPNGVIITHDDMLRYQKDFEAGRAHLLTHGHYDSIELKIVTRKRAEELAEMESAKTGRA